MKFLVIVCTAFFVLVSGCATTAQSGLSYTPEVRKLSYADDTLFHDLTNAIGGVGFADEVSYPNVRQRTITSIEVIVPYDNLQIGVERWTVQHDGQDPASYMVRMIPDGRGGTTFSVQKAPY